MFGLKAHELYVLSYEDNSNREVVARYVTTVRRFDDGVEHALYKSAVTLPSAGRVEKTPTF